MAADIPLANPVTVPPFSCKLPPGLLEGLSERDQYLYQSNDEIKQAVAWMASHVAGTANRVEQVHAQALLTNGKVLTAQADIVTLKESTAPVVRAYGLASAAARSKWGWAGAGVMVFFVLPWLAAHAPNPADFFKLVLGF